MVNFSFEIIATQDQARAGIIHTLHGDIPTPIFAPVGTQATVKALTPAQLLELDTTLVLSNTYHLYLRPGDEIIAEIGGLHPFMGWNRPILTDSGGFQVFSLSSIRKVDDEGVTFKSQIDGSLHRFTPEKSIAIQENLGADIIMAFDECAPPYDRTYCEQALARTHSWAERCLRAKTRSDQALFGIVQGGVFPELRTESARWMSNMDFDGIAIGGLSVGEKKEETFAMVEIVNAILPADKPRYLMGVGSPLDLVQGVKKGVDVFDCVLPTRLARHHTAMVIPTTLTRTGRLNLSNAIFSHDAGPIDTDCNCYTCLNFSRAYLRHLILAKEMLAATLLSIHNIYTLLQLVRNMRESIIAGRFDTFAQEFSTVSFDDLSTQDGKE
jgi:queuine tRNA-ribosyltransferase